MLILENEESILEIMKLSLSFVLVVYFDIID